MLWKPLLCSLMTSARPCLPISAVVAVTPSWGIGCGGALPWAAQGKHLPADMAHFKHCTSHTDDPSKVNGVIMGRLTWESIPAAYRPLPGRINVIVTRAPGSISDSRDTHAVRSFEEALDLLNAMPHVEKAVVIGGAQLFEQALGHPALCQLHLTKVLADFPCDTFLTSRTVQLLQQMEMVAPPQGREVEEDGVSYRYSPHVPMPSLCADLMRACAGYWSCGQMDGAQCEL